MPRLAFRTSLLAGLWFAALPLAAGAQYRQPPQPIAQILDQPATPLVQLSPDREQLLLLERPGLPPVADVAAFEYRLAGLRFDPRTSGPSRAQGYTGLSLLSIAGGAPRRIAAALPAGAAIGNVAWAADGARIAFTVTTDDAMTLWVAEVATAKARQVSSRRLNAVLGPPCAWIAPVRLACTFVPESRGPAPIAPSVPEGPITQEALSGRQDRVATYQDLLKSPFDEQVFAHFGTSQLAVVWCRRHARLDRGARRRRWRGEGRAARPRRHARGPVHRRPAHARRDGVARARHHVGDEPARDRTRGDRQDAPHPCVARRSLRGGRAAPPVGAFERGPLHRSRRFPHDA
jgi:hypothetical protein